MNPKQIHRGILGRLLSLKRDRYVAQVRLVARLHDARLLGGKSVRPILFFIPDLHLMTKAGDRRYRYSFRKLDPKRYLKRDVLLAQLCEAILGFRNELPDPSLLKVVQLGDLVDLWREVETKGETVDSTVRRILNDNPVVRKHLIGKTAASLQAELLRGNHDWNMIKSTDLQHAKIAHVYTVNARKTVLATHGHFFDWVEDFEDEIQEAMVEKFGPKAPPAKYKLDRTKEPEKDAFIDEEEDFLPADDEDTGSQGEAPRVVKREEESDSFPPRVNVWVTKGTFNLEKFLESHKLLQRAVTFAKRIRTGNKTYLKRLGISEPLPDLRTIVIGHSHYARICIHYQIVGSPKPLVLADCGAWIEYARFNNKPAVGSCQIGVLCGGDMRIYQLDPHDDLRATR